MASLPFTRAQFFDAFGAYNETLWPFALALWLLTAGAVVMLGRGDRGAARFFTLLLAIHWAWSALAYHAAFFSSINPAAWLFAVLFLIEAGLFAWGATSGETLQFSRGPSPRYYLSWALIGYALLYPGFAWSEGDAYPRLPTFGVPCPTTILTIGFLLAAEPPVRVIFALIPIVWAFIGGSAAFLLGVHADLILFAAGICLTASLIGSANSRRVPSWLP